MLKYTLLQSALIKIPEKEKKMTLSLHKKILPYSKKTADLVTFTEEILNGKLHFLCCLFSRPRRINPENLWFSGVFRGYKMGPLASNGLMYVLV